MFASIMFFQLDIFQLVGAPLVENCLAGFNSSVFAYGQVSSVSIMLLLQIHINSYRARAHTLLGYVIPTEQRYCYIYSDWERKDIYNVGTCQCLVGR